MNTNVVFKTTTTIEDLVIPMDIIPSKEFIISDLLNKYQQSLFDKNGKINPTKVKELYKDSNEKGVPYLTFINDVYDSVVFYLLMEHFDCWVEEGEYETPYVVIENGPDGSTTELFTYLEDLF